MINKETLIFQSSNDGIANATDAVNLELLLKNTIFLQRDGFDTGRKKLTNITYGTDGMCVINARQLNDLQWSIKYELYKIVKILNFCIDQVILTFYNLGDAA